MPLSPLYSSSHHICPYAAALSDDEDGDAGGGGCDYLSEARKKCPAFANNAPCPFRNVRSNPESLISVMKQVPPSHYHLLASSSSSGDGENEATITTSTTTTSASSSSSTAAATLFQLAMEHVHHVSSTLLSSNDNTISANIEKNENDKHHDYLSNFILPGGCPFKAYHRRRYETDNNNDHTTSTESSSRHLHLSMLHAMEEFSLSAIMGRMALENDNNNNNVVVSGEHEGITVEDRETVNNTTQHVIDDGDGNDVDNTNEDSSNDVDRRIVNDTTSYEEQQQPPPPPRSLLSQALKTGTAKSHTAAENVHFVHNFINGIIDRELYKDMITGLYHIYVTLENLLELYAPTYFPTLHFPMELNRVESLREDMEYWHGMDWEKRMECNTPSPAVQDYMNRMNEVGRLDPLLLLSHAYTRYLGDLSGGKVLSRIARRALHLGKKNNNNNEGDTNNYDGLQFYHFDRVPSAKLFKDKYRVKLDELSLSPSEVRKLVAEANVAFALNMRVFEELDVKGGVVGARVRNVREALSYYDIEMKDDDDDDARSGEALNNVSEDDSEEAKCPFGFGSGPNPHQRESVVATKKAAKKIRPPSSSQTGEENRCPWPFVFFHDPLTGAKDWQTWFVIGLALCYAWSSVNQG